MPIPIIRAVAIVMAALGFEASHFTAQDRPCEALHAETVLLYGKQNRSENAAGTLQDWDVAASVQIRKLQRRHCC